MEHVATAKETLAQQAQTIRHDAMRGSKVKKGHNFNLEVVHVLEVISHTFRQDVKLTESQQLILLGSIADMIEHRNIGLYSQALAIITYIRGCRKENLRHH